MLCVCSNVIQNSHKASFELLFEYDSDKSVTFLSFFNRRGHRVCTENMRNILNIIKTLRLSVPSL